jgi:hypothetical protein
MSDQPVAEASIYIGQHNILTQETNIHAPSGIRAPNPNNQAAAGLHLRPRGHWDRLYIAVRISFFRGVGLVPKRGCLIYVIISRIPQMI